MHPLHQVGAPHHCPYPLSQCVQAGGGWTGKPPCQASSVPVEPVQGRHCVVPVVSLDSSIISLKLMDTPQPAHLLLELCSEGRSSYVQAGTVPFPLVCSLLLSWSWLRAGHTLQPGTGPGLAASSTGAMGSCRVLLEAELRELK